MKKMYCKFPREKWQYLIDKFMGLSDNEKEMVLACLSGYFEENGFNEKFEEYIDKHNKL